MKLAEQLGNFGKFVGAGTVLGGMAGALYGYARVVEPHWFETVYLSIQIKRLGQAFNGYKIVQLSDFHMSPYVRPAYIEKVIAAANAEKPDLVVLTGDFVSKHVKYVYDLVGLLPAFSPPDGVLAVLGNHDYHKGALTIETALISGGVRVLKNEGVILQRGSQQLYVAGLDDAKFGRPDLPQAMANHPPNTPAILLVHEPDVADVVAQNPAIQLQLSGHTHAGQVKLPFIGTPSALLPSLGKKYLEGFYQIGELQLYVNRGIGVSNYPMRFNCRPEMTIITLNAHRSLE